MWVNASAAYSAERLWFGGPASAVGDVPRGAGPAVGVGQSAVDHVEQREMGLRAELGQAEAESVASGREPLTGWLSASARSPVHSCPMAMLFGGDDPVLLGGGQVPTRRPVEQVQERGRGDGVTAAGLRVRECTICSSGDQRVGRAPVAGRDARPSGRRLRPASRVIASKSCRWKWQTAAASSVLAVGSQPGPGRRGCQRGHQGRAARR